MPSGFSETDHSWLVPVPEPSETAWPVAALATLHQAEFIFVDAMLTIRKYCPVVGTNRQYSARFPVY